MAGLQYFKLDLHTHTPASKCYLDKTHTAEQIVAAAIEKGLDGIAITDHNTANWIDQMKAAAEGTGLIVFPGVEISMREGYHFVALFDPSVDQKHVENFLGSIHIQPSDFGQSEALCKICIDEVVDAIHDMNGLAIFAHIDAPMGAFYENTTEEENGKVRVPNPCSNLFNSTKYDAIELVGKDYPNGYDKKHNLKKFPAFYQASDNPDPNDHKRHSKEGLGNPYSWFKMEEINLEGLRQAFTDPETRIHLMDDYQPTKYPHIVSMKVGNSGFLRYQSFKLHNGLNCIIGGKGVGKSLAIEFLRFALQQPPENEYLIKDHIGKLERRLEEGNTVEVVYELEDGSRYNIERQLIRVNRDKSLETYEKCTNIETNVEYKGDIPTLFPILAYSQTEVIKIAENKNAQLQLIDRFIDPKPHLQEIDNIQSQLIENDKLLASAIYANDRMKTVKVEIETLEAKINGLKKSLEDPLFSEYEKSEQKKRGLETYYKYLEDFIETIKTNIDEIRIKKPGDLSPENKEDPDFQKVYKITTDAHKKALQSFEVITKELGQDKTIVSDVLMNWLPHFERVEKAYKELLNNIGGDRKAKEKERKDLEEQKATFDKEAANLEKLLKDLPNLIVTRNVLLDDLERAHRKYYDTRKAKYDELTKLSDGKLKVELEHASDHVAFEEKLVEMLRGGMNAPSVSDRKRIAQNMMPRRFVQLVLDKNAEYLQNEAEITPTPAQNTMEKLWSSNDFTQVLALQHNAYPADVPTIKFRKEGDIYGELDELSVGQKCTALLIIALCDGKMPVVIDQPEDALDIASVWEDVAKKLRRGKDQRQFILTTHNSSVAVGGDSDQFFVLKAGAEYGRILQTGAIDSDVVRQLVIDHLEGGEEPYKLRAGKYNI